jgi:alpha-L-fucosidase
LSGLPISSRLSPNNQKSGEFMNNNHFDSSLPTQSHLAWQDLEFGMFYHFDIPIYKPGWDWRSWQDLPSPDLYQPSKLNTDQWLEAACACGAKYAVFVAKHCSGFCQWQTDIYPYGVKQSSWRNGRGDVVEDFVNSCHKYNIKPGIYASVSANSFLEVENPGIVNRGKGGNAEKQKNYVQICEQMMIELLSRYGELFEIWFDGGAIPVEQGGPDLIPIISKYQPQAIVFQGPPGTRNLIRWAGNERGIAPYPCWSTTNAGTSEGGTVEKKYPGDPNGNIWAPAECDVPVRRDQWYWTAGGESELYSLDELMNMYYCSVGRNSNLLLNANPGPDGLIPKADMKRYIEFGKEIKRRFSSPLLTIEDQLGEQIELDFGKPEKVNHIIIMEDIADGGEQILEYRIEGLQENGEWQILNTGESVGHKRIQRFATVTVPKIRLNITKVKSHLPRIRHLSAYHS